MGKSISCRVSLQALESSGNVLKKIIKTKPVSILNTYIPCSNNYYYYMANPVLGKSLCSDWFFLGQDFAVRTVSTEMVQPVYFCFGAKPANSKFATKTAKKNCEYCHSSQ